MISCVVNFKENLIRSDTYYKLLLSCISDDKLENKVLEHCAMSAKNEPYTKICEGYQFTMIFSGELWDNETLKNNLKASGYRFLTDDSCELALNAYIHYGEGCMNMLKGSFSFVVYDAMRRCVFAAVDRFASHTLFYAKKGEETVICSAVTGILHCPDMTAKVTCEGLCELLTFPEYPSGNAFDGIYAIPPSSCLKVSAAGISILPYSPPEYSPCFDDDGDVGVILTKGKNSLCEMLADKQSKRFCRISTYSFADTDEVAQKYSCKHTRLKLGEHMLRESIKTCVVKGGFPVLSEDEYLLPLILSQTETENVYLGRLSKANSTEAYYEFALKNHLFHTPVMDTIKKSAQTGCGFLRTSEIGGADLRVRYLPECSGIAIDDKELEMFLRRMLLEVIARQNTPIAAFFDRKALLKLCEGRYDAAEISTSALMAYLLQLDMWFSEFKPRLL